MKTDEEFLARYVSGDEDAFREIVGRHGNMVYATSLRLLKNQQLAEDSGQAVFLLLVKKARRLKSGVVLSGWLYRTAIQTAMEARRNDARRARHEKRAATMQGEANGKSSNDALQRQQMWEEIRPRLDQEISALSKPLREALILRYLEERSLEGAAKELGCPIGTVSARLTRGIAKLRQRLDPKGSRMSAALLLLLLEEHVGLSAPPSFNSIAEASMNSGSASAETLTILENTVNTMFRTQAMLYTSIALVTLVVGLGMPMGYYHLRASESNPPVKTVVKGATETPATKTKEISSDPSVKSSAAQKKITEDRVKPSKSDIFKAPAWVNLGREVFIRAQLDGTVILIFSIAFKNPMEKAIQSHVLNNSGIVSFDLISVVDGKGRDIKFVRGPTIKTKELGDTQDITFTLPEPLQPGASFSCRATLRLKSGVLIKKLADSFFNLGYENRFKLFSLQQTLGRLVVELPKKSDVLVTFPGVAKTIEKNGHRYLTWDSKTEKLACQVYYTLPGAKPAEVKKIMAALKAPNATQSSKPTVEGEF